MKKSLFLAVLMFVLAFTINAQNDTMYIMKNGVVAGKYNVNNQVDSVIFYQPTIAPGNTFTDSRDANVYRTVTIGNQVWMAENLKYLPSIVETTTGSSTKAYYYVYGYSGTNITDAKATVNYSTYGVLYNWTAAMAGSSSSSTNPSGVQGICPSGWHLPSDAEWTQLTTYLGDVSVAGGKLKEIGTTHWLAPNTGATNETGFTALPGGYRENSGEFSGIGYHSHWWGASEGDSHHAHDRAVYHSGSDVGRCNDDKKFGFSVRCVRD